MFFGIAGLPIGYYAFLRIVITIGAIAVIITGITPGITFWVVVFGLVAVLFNPLIPVYLYNKSTWAIIDGICGVLFLIKVFNLKPGIKY